MNREAAERQYILSEYGKLLASLARIGVREGACGGRAAGGQAGGKAEYAMRETNGTRLVMRLGKRLGGDAA